jgi:hypothetical protein
MDADAIYRELGKFVVSFQWLENQLVQIICFIVDPECKSDPREKFASMWFKNLTDSVEQVLLEYIDGHVLEDAEGHKKNFRALIERCRKLGRYRNKLVHSTFLHLQRSERKSTLLARQS